MKPPAKPRVGCVSTIAQETPTATFGDAGEETVAVADVSKHHEDPKVGDAESAFAKAAVKVEAIYSTPTQHHNPIELFTTICAWNGDRLTVWESSQKRLGFQEWTRRAARNSSRKTFASSRLSSAARSARAVR